VVSDEEFEKIMNIKERFAVSSNDSLNLNHRKTLNSIMRTTSRKTNKSIGQVVKVKEENGNLKMKRKSNKRVSFANSLLSKTQSNENDFEKRASKRGSILKNG
jgi:hypothetical protein